MSSTLSIGKDINGVISDAIHISEKKVAVTLPANTVTTVVVPPRVDVAIFSYGSSGDVWVNLSGAASVPGASFVNTNSELNPVARNVVPGQTISCLCLFANPVQISFYNTRNY